MTSKLSKKSKRQAEAIKQRKSRLLWFDVNSGLFETKAKPLKTKKINPKAIIYCRVSDKKQVTEGHWLEGQQRVCEEWCLKNNIWIDQIFLEPWVSGADFERKEFQKALSYLNEQNKVFTNITHFIVTEASRISRPEDIAQAFIMEEKIKSYGVDIIKVDTPGLDDNTDEGHLFKTIQYAVAGYERKKIAKRVANGRRNRLLNGHRPFPKPPVGYKRTRLSKRDYLDEIDPLKAPIMKEGFELYASDVIQTQADLRRFRSDKGLLSSTPWVTKLQRNIVEQVFQLHRLFFYAWFIIYPEWDVNEPIEWAHEGIISLSTVYEIIQKLQKDHRATNKIKLQCFRMSDQHPLRGVVRCEGCGRLFTSRNTSKMVNDPDKPNVKVKKLYPYYGCNNKDCLHRVNVKKAELEQQFELILAQIKLPSNIIKLLESIFDEQYEFAKSNKSVLKERTAQNIRILKDRMSIIERTLLKTSNVKLYDKLEAERAELDCQLWDLEEQGSLGKKDENAYILRLSKVKMLFSDPLGLWRLSNQQMRGLLIKVRFWGELHYSKIEGLKTVENQGLLRIISSLKDGISTHWAIEWFYKTELHANFQPLLSYISKYKSLISEIYNKSGQFWNYRWVGQNQSKLVGISQSIKPDTG